jgi:hypothetical protein
MSAAMPHISARFDELGFAVLDELVPLNYVRPAEGLPGHARAASALRLFENRLVVVQDDVNALAVVETEQGGVSAVLLPAHESGMRVFDDVLGNKRDKLDLEACVTLHGMLIAFGSGSTPAREQLVVWDHGEAPILVAAPAFYREVRAAVTRGEGRLNIEGAVARGGGLELFHRGNDVRDAGMNAIVEVQCDEFERWLAGGETPRVAGVTTVDLGAESGVPFGFTDAVAIDDDRIVVLACAEDSASAISDGAVLGCRVGMLADGMLTMVDVHDVGGARSLLKLEGIERRPGSSIEFDVAVDVDRPTVPAMLGRLVWEWR